MVSDEDQSVQWDKGHVLGQLASESTPTAASSFQAGDCDLHRKEGNLSTIFSPASF